MRILVPACLVLLAVAFSPLMLAGPRQLTFQERVEAQQAIERVYYSHQIGAAKKWFEEAIP